MSRKVVINGEECEIEETPAEQTIAFFKEPIKVEKSCPVDETYLSNYEEMKADEKIIKENIEIMNAAIKGAFMPGEKSLSLGKMAAFIQEIEVKPKVDWEAMARAELGNAKGEIDAETLKKYTTAAKSQTRLTVKRLG